MYKFAKKLNMWFDYEFELKDGMYCTVPTNKQDPWCWQSIVSEVEIPLEKISIDEYKKRFGDKRKTKK